MNITILLQGEPFHKMKDRLLKKLGVQEKEFEKVGILILSVLTSYENS